MAQVFPGTSRFEVLSRLGRGGMGSVYRVLDRERRSHVALKAVGPVEGDALLRFKREFRALQDIRHPNIVELGELFEENGEWFYTMELLEGVDFLAYVRTDRKPKPPPQDDDLDHDDDTATDGGGASTRAAVAAASSGIEAKTMARKGAPLSPEALARLDLGYDEAKLRQAMHQLCRAIVALHKAHKVHRDLKPSNTVVTHDGRLVVIDFGLVTDLRDGKQDSDVGMMGTYAYMSPEQAAGLSVDVRADWYCVGAMLFQALTGRLPFQGSVLEVLNAKTRLDPPRPSDFAPGVPPDLDDLCFELIQRDPAKRPHASAIFARLAITSNRAADDDTAEAFGVADEIPFVGRERELARLESLAEVVGRKGAASALVHGEPGIGKSSVLVELLRRLERQWPGCVVLHGRCSPFESMPFSAADGIIDGLSSHLARMTPAQARAISPPDLPHLLGAFPVLKRVEPFLAIAEARVAPILDPQERRSRVFRALRDLMLRLADSQRVVVVLEDLQWMDSDSRALLGEVLRPPLAPPMLFIATLRTNPEGSAGADPTHDTATDIDALLEGFGAVPFTRVPLGPLSPRDAESLAASMLGADEGQVPAWVLGEAKGHPLMLHELARYAERHRAPSDDEGGPARLVEAPPEAGLDQVIRERIGHLDAESQAILELLCLSGGECGRDLLQLASGLDVVAFDRRCTGMRLLRLLKDSPGREERRIETYHGRIHEALVAGLGDEAARAGHLRIAAALEAAEVPDHAALAIHYRAAGEERKGGEHAALAGDAAMAVLAFERAAALYGAALDSGVHEGAALERLRVKRAIALASAGLGARAGEAFLAAAANAGEVEALELRRRAAEQFMLCGRLEEGTQHFVSVLRALGERYPTSRAGVVASMLVALSRVTLAGETVEARSTDAADPLRGLRLDTLQSAATAMASIDSIRGGELLIRTQLAAIRAGEPARVARAFAYEGVRLAGTSAKSHVASLRSLRRAARWAERAGTPEAAGAVRYCEGLSAYLNGRFVEALERLREADGIFRTHCREMPPEHRSLQAILVPLLWELGDYGELRVHVSEALKKAQDWGDLFLEANVRGTGAQLVACLDGDPDAAASLALRAIKRWKGAFHNQHYSFHEARAMADLYRGDPGSAYERIDGVLGDVRASMIGYVQLMRARVDRAHGLLAVATAAKVPSERRRRNRIARAAARRLRADPLAWTRAAAHLIDAGLARQRGDTDACAVALALAMHAYREAGMLGHLHAVMASLGRVVGGDEGAGYRATAHAFFREQHVVDPDRIVEMLAPGFGD